VHGIYTVPHEHCSHIQWGFCYDGFGRRVESDLDYLLRLDRTAAEIDRLVKTHRPQAVVLQESSAWFLRGETESVGKGKMYELLQSSLPPLGYTVTTSGEFITAVFGETKPEVVDLSSGLPRQGAKMHIVHSTELKIALLNVHLAYDMHGTENEATTKSELQTVVSCIHERFPTSSLILVGDTNRVPEEQREQVDPGAATIEQLAEGVGSVLMPPGHTNVKHHKGTDSDCSPTYADFAICIRAARC
jgi:hypothetical protein